jgi:hypothetical protein
MRSPLIDSRNARRSDVPLLRSPLAVEMRTEHNSFTLFLFAHTEMENRAANSLSNQMSAVIT